MESTSIDERYFTYLETPYVTPDGTRQQPASTKYVEALRGAHERSKPRIDLNACLAGTKPGFNGQVWFWSDHHLFHEALRRRRPFSTIEEMNEVMLKNCLERVKREDILVFGGDITMGDLTATNRWLRQIPCRKMNVLGNHDISKTGELLKLAIDEVVACTELSCNGKSFFLSHYPVPEGILESGQLNLHGHIHAEPVSSTLGNAEKYVNICVEQTDYSPAKLEWLLSKATSDAAPI